MKIIALLTPLSLICCLGCKTASVTPDPNQNISSIKSITYEPGSIFCRDEENKWGLTSNEICKYPYKLCYYGKRSAAISRINGRDQITVSEDHKLDTAKNSRGSMISARIWDMPNSVAAGKVAISPCRRTSLPVEVPVEPLEPSLPRPESIFKCKGEDGTSGFIEDTLCDTNTLVVCYLGSRDKAIEIINGDNSPQITDEVFLQNAVATSRTKIKASVWDGPNDTEMEKIEISVCR